MKIRKNCAECGADFEVAFYNRNTVGTADFCPHCGRRIDGGTQNVSENNSGCLKTVIAIVFIIGFIYSLPFIGFVFNGG